MQKWIKLEYSPFELYKKYFFIILVIIFFITVAILLMLIWNRTLKRRVEQRTEELENSKNFFYRVVDSIVDPVFVKDREHKWVLLNDACCKIIGHERETLLGKTDFDFFSEDESKVFWKKDELVFESGLDDVNEERLTDNDGKVHFIITKKSLYEDQNNNKFIVGIISDITEEINREQQLVQAQKMQTIGNLAGGIAHDFNNILGGIMGSITLIKHKYEKERKGDFLGIDKYLTNAIDSSVRAKNVIDQLLLLSRKSEISLVPIDLNRSLKNVVKIANNSFDKSIEINVNYSSRNPIVNGDFTQIEQVLLNLFINASHAMTIMKIKENKIGGILNVFISEITPDNEIFKSRPDIKKCKYWMISVGDTGVGIDENIVSHIFEPFFTTKEEGNGSGLGLSMAYSIIKNHNGFIEVSSIKGVGTIFEIYLPVLEKTVEYSNEKENGYDLNGSGSILIVDDDKIMLETAKAMLEECGYTITTAVNGEAGLEIYRDSFNEIDMVILDLVMPKKSGHEAYYEMKKINPTVKVLLSSGFKDDDRVIELMDSGVNEFIQKPYVLSKLCKIVKYILKDE